MTAHPLSAVCNVRVEYAENNETRADGQQDYSRSHRQGKNLDSGIHISSSLVAGANDRRLSGRPRVQPDHDEPFGGRAAPTAC